jgi:hypothetical protein
MGVSVVDKEYEISLAIVVAIVALVALICMVVIFFVQETSKQQNCLTNSVCDVQDLILVSNDDIVQKPMELFNCTRRFVSEKTCQINNYGAVCASCLWENKTVYWDVVPLI